MSSFRIREVQMIFRRRGLTLRSEALPVILRFLDRFPEDENEALHLIIDEFQFQELSLRSSILGKEEVQRVVDMLLDEG